MQETLKTIGEIFAIWGVIGGFLGWFIGGLLTNRKDIVILQTENTAIKQEFEKLHKEFDDHIKEYNEYRMNGGKSRRREND